jgi:hypothetical protein
MAMIKNINVFLPASFEVILWGSLFKIPKSKIRIRITKTEKEIHAIIAVKIDFERCKRGN